MRTNTITGFASIVGAGLLLCSCAKPGEDAQKAEARGDYATAMSLYLGQMMKTAPGMKYPDKTEATLLKPPDFQKRVGDYLAWVSAEAPIQPDVSALLQSIDRCTTSIEPKNHVVDMAVKEATADSLAARWRDAFFPPHMSLPPAHRTMVDVALRRSVSMITLYSGDKYSYEGCLFERATGRRTSFSLYGGSHISFLAQPGEYELMCKSKVSFSAAEQWESPLSVFRLSAPAKSILITGKLMTRVKRSKPG